MSVEDSRKRLLEVERKLNEIVIGHENFVRALMLASVSGEHIVVIGYPGTAKSYTVRAFSKLLNARFYSYLLTKFTTFDELFGVIDIPSLTRGEYKRNWSRIVSSEFIFLDEIFKANSAILNALLSLLQERVIYDPMSGSEMNTQLWTAVGASNETPDDPELQALYDRFAIKIFIDYLNDDVLLRRALESRWSNSFNIANLSSIASMSDIKTLHSYAMSLMNMNIEGLGSMWTIYQEYIMPVIKRMREKGILVSDRTIIEKMPKLFASYIVLYGMVNNELDVNSIMTASFELVKYLARTRDELKDIEKAIEDSMGDVAELSKKLEKAREYLNAFDIINAEKVIKEILNYDVSKLEKTPWLKPQVEAILHMAREYMSYIIKIKEELKRFKK
jgi:MoxR-like ATPase